MFRNFLLCSAALMLAACCGCGDSPAPPPMGVRLAAAPKPVPPPAGDPGAPEVKPGAEVPTQFGGPQFTSLVGSVAATNSGSGGTAPPAANPAAPADDQNAVRAEAGVGAQGKDYGNGDAGIITVPISTYFGARQVITFQQLEKAMITFKALNNRVPKSQQEFDEKIIKEWGIGLPDLPEGQKYFYDPQKGELMVRQPKPK
jgi:hypothetical protein